MMRRGLRVVIWVLVGVLWMMVQGCLGNTPLRKGFPCRNDADCKGPSFQLYCGANRTCKAESCAAGSSRKCFTGDQGCNEDGTNCQGACVAGTQSCVDGFWSICTGQTLPAEEVCDGKDNNCDGQIDETFPEKDTSCEFKNEAGQGLGAGGLNVCTGGTLECKVEGEVVILARDQSFSMGTPTRDSSRRSDEPPTYTVEFKYNYSLGQTEVTQKQFQDLMGYNPSINKGTSQGNDNKPVNNISWHEAAAYTVLLSRKNNLDACFTCTPNPEEGKVESIKDQIQCQVAATFSSEAQQYVTDCPGYRLPTESEWLYGYRAGENYRSYYNGDQVPPSPSDREKCYSEPKLDTIAWYCSDQGDQPNEVLSTSKKPNRWNLHEMSGNVAEWIFDVYSPTFAGSSLNRVGPKPSQQDQPRVVKGGSYESTPSEARGHTRDKKKPSERSALIGVRVARTIQK